MKWIVFVFVMTLFAFNTVALDAVPQQNLYCTIESQYLSGEHCLNNDCSAEIAPFQVRHEYQTEFFKDKQRLVFNDFIYMVTAEVITTSNSYGVSGTGFDFFPEGFLDVVDTLCVEDISELEDISETIPNNEGFEIDIRVSPVMVELQNFAEWEARVYNEMVEQGKKNLEELEKNNEENNNEKSENNEESEPIEVEVIEEGSEIIEVRSSETVEEQPTTETNAETIEENNALNNENTNNKNAKELFYGTIIVLLAIVIVILLLILVKIRR